MARQLGVSDRHGVAVGGVVNDSPAASAGIHPGDVIVAVDRHPVTTVDEVKGIIAKHSNKRPILFRVDRNGTDLYVAVTG